jgi:hypothetical protein
MISGGRVWLDIPNALLYDCIIHLPLSGSKAWLDIPNTLLYGGITHVIISGGRLWLDIPNAPIYDGITHLLLSGGQVWLDFPDVPPYVGRVWFDILYVLFWDIPTWLDISHALFKTAESNSVFVTHCLTSEGCVSFIIAHCLMMVPVAPTARLLLCKFLSNFVIKYIYPLYVTMSLLREGRGAEIWGQKTA